MKYLISYNESIRDKMTPKSKEDVISTFERADIQVKKNMVNRLFHENFKSTSEYFQFVRTYMGMDIWNRVMKKETKYRFVSDLLDVLKKHEIERLFMLMIEKGKSVNESVRDMMTPKSIDDIKQKLDNPDDLLELFVFGCEKKQGWIIRYTLDSGLDIHIEDDAPLRIACRYNCKNTVKLLLEKGANVHAAEDDALMWAYELDDNFIVDLLYKYGARLPDINESVRDKMTPKSEKEIDEGLEKLLDEIANRLVSEGGYKSYIRALAELKNSLNYIIDKREDGWSTDELVKKFSKKTYESVRDKMTPKSEEDIKKDWSELSKEKLFDKVLRAVTKPDFEVLDFLNKTGFDINIRDTQNETPFMHACKVDSVTTKTIRLLVEKYGADVNAKDKSLRTPLMYAVDGGRLSVVKLLIELGVKINKYNQGPRALIRAIGHNMDYDIVETLVKAGADVNFFDNNHSTAIIYAALQSRRQVIELLLSKGADVNVQNENGMSPLMMSATKNDQEIIKMLLDAGANTDTKNNNRQAAIDVAIAWGKKDNVELLKNYKKVNEGIRDKMTPKSDEEVRKAAEDLPTDEKMEIGCRNGILWMVEEAMEEGYSIHTQNDIALRNACAFGYIDIVKFLLDNKADIHVEFEFPLRSAAFIENTELVDYLISRGADFDRIYRQFLVTPEDHKIHSFLIKYNAKRLTKQHEDRLKDMMGESVRDMMKPKTKEEIDEELEDLEPLERVQAQLNNQLNDIYNKVEPYYSQSQVDNLCEEFVRILNYSHSADDMIDALYPYIHLSDVIKRELKYNLSLLSPEEQIQNVHDIEVLGSLYTDKEWFELGVKNKKR